jgi:hypothetical protein
LRAFLVAARARAGDDRRATRATRNPIDRAAARKYHYAHTGLAGSAARGRRTFLVLLDGFEKGMDVHGAFPLAVEPLPFRAMPSYPYPEGAYPADEFHLEYVFTWNTRHVSE